ncbi:MAG: isoprenylcysteine carboxylmethyltransferase family protein [Nitrososphaerota archaeon]|nr:isoprenylcysteine carboxylmethyltransferase family protein [Nitrososphaerota archaeon]
MDEEIFDAVYVVWLGAAILERVIIARSGQGESKTKRDRGSALLIFSTIFVSVAIAFAFAGASVGILPAYFFYVGIALMIMGILVREWAVATLKGYFSYRVRVREDHRIVESGPYRFVRHPAYSGSILLVLGIGVAVRSWVGVLVLTVAFGLAYGYRIRVEESLLLEELGEEYSNYMKRTKRLFPHLI